MLFDRWLQLKLISVFLIFGFWTAAIVITFYLADFSGYNGDMDEGYWYTFVELTPDEASEFVLCWYLAIFVWGVIINEIRIVIISLMAPIRAQTLFDKTEDFLIENNDKKKEDVKEFNKKWVSFHNAWWTKASFATCCLIPPESVEIALDALYTIAIEKDGSDKIYPSDSGDPDRRNKKPKKALAFDVP